MKLSRRKWFTKAGLLIPACGIIRPTLAQTVLLNSFRFAAPGGGGGGGPFSFVKSAGVIEAGSDANIAVQLATVTAGNLIVLLVNHEGATTTIACSDGTTSFTGATKVTHTASGDMHTQFFYLLSSVASGTVTYTATFGAARAFKAIVAYEIDPTATPAFDAEASGGGTSGTGGVPSSGNMTTTVAAGIALGGYGHYSGNSMGGLTINGVAHDGARGGDNASGVPQTTTCIWHRITAATFTGAAAGQAIASEWTCLAIAFK